MTLMEMCRRNTGSEEVRRQKGRREIHSRLNSMSPRQRQRCQRGFDFSLEEPGRSESPGFYRKTHHCPEMIPSSEHKQQISHDWREAEGSRVFTLTLVPPFYHLGNLGVYYGAPSVKLNV